MQHSDGRADPDYGISRIDNELYRTHAWRVSLRRHGQVHVKNFPDKKCGGRQQALQRARHHRDGSLKENWYWEASWPDERGESTKAVFSVNLHGDEIAKQMAINARRRGLPAGEPPQAYRGVAHS